MSFLSFRLLLFIVSCFAIMTMLVSPCLAGHGEEREAKVGILLVAFGSTIPEAREALAHVEVRVSEQYPDTEIRWAYSAALVRSILREQGLEYDSPAMALARMMEDGFTHVAVQSLHTIPGEEYHGLLQTAHAFSGMPKGMDTVLVGSPLLATAGDLQAAADAIMANLPTERTPGDAVILLGHGTHHPGDAMYAALQYHLWQRDPNVFVGTVEGVPALDDIRPILAERTITKAYLLPFMAVAGDHAINDMAGDEPDSWNSILTADGVETVCVLKGTAEYDAVVDIWLAHLASALAHF
ncbi:MAG: sirohydrochlorin cobaltochelatase [Desulfovibrio sp.]|nr:MAG: sirohydrochlorin cobaltochelatase [Desulfovibrio sp.]